MKEINIENWERNKTYNWFKNFSNSTYCMNVRMDVTSLVEHTKKNKKSFFINFLYIILKGLDSVEAMRMRLVDDKPVIYDEVNPAITVMTQAGTFENVRFKNLKDYKEFYKEASSHIESAKKQTNIKKDDYNPKNCYNEYYITCTPWVDFTGVTNPISDNIASQCIPIIVWGKYTKEDSKYKLTLHITVSHIFVDGYPISQVFNNIQEYLNNAEEILK